MHVFDLLHPSEKVYISVLYHSKNISYSWQAGQFNPLTPEICGNNLKV